MRIQAPEAWLLVDGGESVLIAVLDTGIDDTHPSLRGKIVDRVNFTQSGSGDINGHGTHIAGIIASANKDGNPPSLSYNSKLLDVKVAEDSGFTDAAKIAKGIIWAADHGAAVINMSLVINRDDPSLESAVSYAWGKGCILVAAAGNDFSSKPVYPAAYPAVLSVGASDRNDNPTKWSNRGDWVDVMAPGVDIYSTFLSGGYIYKSGTSVSAALVSGEVALIFMATRDTNGNGQINDEILETILSTCDRLPGQTSTGRINVFRATESTITRHSLCQSGTMNQLT